jgi:hypothetical protein
MPDGPSNRARQWPALRASIADRLASATARRTHVGAVRAAVRTQLADNQLRRQAMAQALAELRRGLLEFRADVRTKLRALGIDMTNARTSQKSRANHGSTADEDRH